MLEDQTLKKIRTLLSPQLNSKDWGGRILTLSGTRIGFPRAIHCFLRFPTISSKICEKKNYDCQTLATPTEKRTSAEESAKLSARARAYYGGTPLDRAHLSMIPTNTGSYQANWAHDRKPSFWDATQKRGVHKVQEHPKVWGRLAEMSPKAFPPRKSSLNQGFPFLLGLAALCGSHPYLYTPIFARNPLSCCKRQEPSKLRKIPKPWPMTSLPWTSPW